MGTHVFAGTVAADPATQSTHLSRKDQVDAAVASALARANHTGTQLAATISDLQTYVDGRVQNVVGAAPAALDTLNELAAALGNDANFASTVNGQLGTLGGRVTTLENAGAAGVYKTNIGDAVAATFTVTHNLATLDVTVEVVRISDGQTVFPVVKRPSTNTVSVDFGATVPASASHRVLIRKV